MARITHAAQIDLRFGNPARQLQDFGFGVWPGNFARERVHLFGKNGIGKNRHAQTVAKRISRRAGAALSGFRAGAGPCVGAVCLDLARARHAGSFPSDLPQCLETAGLELCGAFAPSGAQFAASLRRVLSFRGRRLNYLEFAFLHFLQAPPQRFAEHRTTPFDLAQADVAASLGDTDQAIDPLDLIEFSGQCPEHEVVHGLGRSTQEAPSPA